MNHAVRTLYTRLLTAWNDRDAKAYAALFTPDATLVGFDGTQVAGDAVADHLGPIFGDHPTAAYVAKVCEIREVGAGVVLLRAIAGMVPPGQQDLKPETNAVQTLLAVQDGEDWRITLFQNTQAQYHDRPEATEEHLAALRPVLEAGEVVS